jgi:drug/metabolite transporter (DMT)-like permease
MNLPPWTIAALAASLCFGAHYTLLRAASGKVGDAMGGLVLELAAAAGLLVLVLVGPRDGVATTTAGLVWSVLSGLAITGGVTLLFLSLRLGGPVAGTGTIALGGGVALAALVAPLFFDEALTPRRLVGVGLGVAATLVLATER